MPRTHPFRYHRFAHDIILCAVRWYLRFPLSYQDVVDLLAERDISVDRSMVCRWGLVAQMWLQAQVPFPEADSFYGPRNRCAEHGLAVEHSDTNLQLGDLAFEGEPLCAIGSSTMANGHRGLAEQPDAVHL